MGGGSEPMSMNPIGPRSAVAKRSHWRTVTDVQLGRNIQFGVAAWRRVRTNASNSTGPGSAVCEARLEVARMSAVHAKVCRRRIGIQLLDRLTQRLAAGQAAISLDRERDRDRQAAAFADRATPMASALVVIVTAESMSTPPFFSATACAR